MIQLHASGPPLPHFPSNFPHLFSPFPFLFHSHIHHLVFVHTSQLACLFFHIHSVSHVWASPPSVLFSIVSPDSFLSTSLGYPFHHHFHSFIISLIISSSSSPLFPYPSLHRLPVFLVSGLRYLLIRRFRVIRMGSLVCVWFGSHVFCGSFSGAMPAGMVQVVSCAMGRGWWRSSGLSFLLAVGHV